MLLGLLVRQQRGIGQKIELALLNTAVATQAFPVTWALNHPETPPRKAGSGHWTRRPLYGVYPTMDLPLTLVVAGEDRWPHSDAFNSRILPGGIHTGLVVVGAMGGGDYQEQLALGDTPNSAARLQGLATPDSVVISEATFRLVEGYCTCAPLGAQTLKGVSHPMPVCRVLGLSGVQSRLDAAWPRGLTPLVGREQDVGVLLERWVQVQDGRGQVVILSGEAGIGKSRLLQVLQEHLSGTLHTRLECRSSPYFQDSALYPLMDLLQRALHAQSPDDTQAPHVPLEQLLGKYRLATAETIPLLARLLSIPLPDGRYPPLTVSPQQQRQKTLEALLALVLAQAAQQPVLFILEDLHWTDPSTLEWLTLLIAQVPTVSLLTLLTCRPEFHPP
jgi:hypothetical protein